MYDVLVVDDEVNILEGISMLVDWERCGTRLTAKAYNGKMAFDLIKEHPPDIVVTDIKMPGMNGIELIEAVHDLFPDIRFIVLSGFDEFEFAKTAMKCGVKHYLLKPSNEQKIEEALIEVVEDLNKNAEKDQFIKDIESSMQQMIPKAKEQFLREFIMNKKYDLREWTHYKELFGIEENTETYKLLALVPDQNNEYERLFMLKEMMTIKLEGVRILLSTIISERVIFLIEDSPHSTLISKVKDGKEKWKQYNESTFTTFISGSGRISNLHQLYEEALNGLTHRFYLGSGSIVTAEDIKKESSTLSFDHEDLLLSIRAGESETVIHYLQQFFEKLAHANAEIPIIQAHCIELFMSVIRQTTADMMDEFFEKGKVFYQLTTLQEIESFIQEIALQVTGMNYDRRKKTQNDLVNEVMMYANKHIKEESLSLTYIATDVFYMNPDYLGKLFKKETGEKFSNYLVKQRMDRATELIEESDEVKVFEVAEAVGFGNNPRYFSQVFKKHTGYTPSEFKKASS